MRACLRACVRACVRVCVCEYACACMSQCDLHFIYRLRDDDTNRETSEGAGLRKQLDKKNRGSEESGKQKNCGIEGGVWSEGKCEEEIS